MHAAIYLHACSYVHVLCSYVVVDFPCGYKLQNRLEMPGGVIVIRNGGGYIARFSVRFTNDERKHNTRESGIFTVGVNKSIEFPFESKDIIVKAEAMWGLGWSTIFTKEFSTAVRKKFYLRGTTLNPSYREDDYVE